MNSQRRIAHLDMDAFFASVELLRYPELCGQAVVVGGRSTHQPVEQPDGTRRFARLRDYVGRGVITTSTYEARALGAVSYTHLTLPTSDLVSISVVVVSFKKKKQTKKQKKQRGEKKT